MICASFAELGVQYKLIWFALRSVWKAIAMGLNSITSMCGKPNAFFAKHSVVNDENFVKDFASEVCYSQEPSKFQYADLYNRRTKSSCGSGDPH